MNTLNLTREDVGKKYRRRNGGVVTVVTFDGDDSIYPVEVSAKDGRWYTTTGRFSEDGIEHHLDLIEEVVEPPVLKQARSLKEAIHWLSREYFPIVCHREGHESTEVSGFDEARTFYAELEQVDEPPAAAIDPTKSHLFTAWGGHATCGDAVESQKPLDRISIPQYAMKIAVVAAMRSEDRHRQVGAVALDHDNRIVATAYNGLAPGQQLPPEVMADRDARRPHMIHAEQNLCSLFRRGDVKTVALTTAPCSSCASLLSAHGVEVVYYSELYDRDESGLEILRLRGIRAERIEP